MDFTREPVIETIITPKEGFKLCVRNSKGAPQEEYFVDALELVSFGHSLFFRSKERPKAFLAPVSDYEVIEVREARMVLKHVGVERSIKIGGGREKSKPAHRENRERDREVAADESEPASEDAPAAAAAPREAREPRDSREPRESRGDKKRRRQTRRRGRGASQEAGVEGTLSDELAESDAPAPSEGGDESTAVLLTPPPPSPRTILRPPPTLISDSIERYREMLAPPEPVPESAEAGENAGFPEEESDEPVGRSREALGFEEEESEVPNDELKW